MDNTIESVLDEMEKNNKLMEEIVKTNKRLAEDLRNRPDKDWDLVSVATASRMLDIAQATIYQRIQRGALKSKRICGKVFVSLKDIKGENNVAVCD